MATLVSWVQLIVASSPLEDVWTLTHLKHPTHCLKSHLSFEIAGPQGQKRGAQDVSSRLT
jgi:hypothetical protein